MAAPATAMTRAVPAVATEAATRLPAVTGEIAATEAPRAATATDPVTPAAAPVEQTVVATVPERRIPRR